MRFWPARPEGSQPVYIASPPSFAAHQQDGMAGLLEPPRQFQVLADRAADGGMPADRVIGVAPDHHDPAGGADFRGRCGLGGEVLQERQENEAARENEPFGEALQFLPRRK